MKRIYKSLLIISIIIPITSWAFGPKSVVNTNVSGTSTEHVVEAVASDAAKVAAEKSINNKLAKENCKFINGTTESDVQCTSGGIDNVIQYIADWRNGLENTISNDVNVHISAGASDSILASKRANYARGKVRAKIGYWDYYVSSLKGNDDLSFRIDVR